MRKCNCGSGQDSWWEYDRRGIPVSRVCPACIKKRLSPYRPEILTANYGKSVADTATTEE